MLPYVNQCEPLWKIGNARTGTACAWWGGLGMGQLLLQVIVHLALAQHLCTQLFTLTLGHLRGGRALSCLSYAPWPLWTKCDVKD